LWLNISRYFLHGILFSVLFIALAIFWGVIFVILVGFGFIIGFIIGFLALFYLLGGMNVFLTDRIWDIQISEDWVDLLIHGLVLFIALIVAHIPSIIIGLSAPGQVTTIVLFFINAFIDGFVARNVGVLWQE